MFDIYYLMGSILSTIKFPLEDVGSDVYISLENGGYFKCDNQFYNNQTCNMCSAIIWISSAANGEMFISLENVSCLDHSR